MRVFCGKLHSICLPRIASELVESSTSTFKVHIFSALVKKLKQQILPHIVPHIVQQIVPQIVPQIVKQIVPQIMPQIIPQISSHIIPQIVPHMMYKLFHNVLLNEVLQNGGTNWFKSPVAYRNCSVGYTVSRSPRRWVLALHLKCSGIAVTSS